MDEPEDHDDFDDDISILDYDDLFDVTHWI